MADGKVRNVDDLEDRLARKFRLSSADRAEMLPKVKRTRLRSNVLWTLTYLRQALLLEFAGRGVNRITQRGMEYVKRAPSYVGVKELKEFPEFVEFLQRSKPAKKDAAEPTEVEVTGKTPEERMEDAYLEHKAALAEQVLEHVKGMLPSVFEQLIVDLMLKLGYGGAGMDSGKTLGKSGDGGVDGVIDQDKLGLEKIYLQAKRWADGTVSRKEIQAFVGAISGKGARKGVFITTSSFTREAKEYATTVGDFKVSLIDGLELAGLMTEYDLGVALVGRYDVKRVDSDFFGTED
jgi:restriction system protein